MLAVCTLRRIAVSLAVCASAVVCAPARATWIVDVDAGVFHDDNLTRASSAADRRSDGAMALRVSAARFVALSGHDALTIGGELRGEAYDRYDGLAYVQARAAVAYRRKLGLGLEAPYLRLAAAAAYAVYRVDVRDGARFDLSVELGKRFDATWSMALGAAHDRRDGKHDRPLVPGISGAIFDLRGSSLYALGDYAFDDRWQLGGRVGARRGDVESTSRRGPAVFRASDAIASDPAFEDAALIGYRLRGTTLSASATLSYALHDDASLNVGYVHEHTRAAHGLEYRSRIVNAAFAYRF